MISSGVQSFGKIGKDLKDVLTIASGGLSGGISESIAGGNFWDGVRQGLISSGLNHVAEHFSDPLNKHRNEASTLDEWVSNYNTCTENEIVTEAGWKDGQPLEPKMRYVINPEDNKVMDMRHVTFL